MNKQICQGQVIDVANKIEIINCITCGFIHALMTESVDFYTSHYYNEEKPDYISSNESENDWWDQTYSDRIDRAEELAGRILTRWIDIGTGPGLFLDAAKKKNKSILGIEPSKRAAEHALRKGHEVVCGYLVGEILSQLGHFDAAHFSEVLEHVTDPVAFLHNVREILKDEGLIVVTVPNDYNPIQEIFTSETGKGKWWLAPPFHVNYFSHKSLTNLLEKCGFEILESTSMFPIDLFLLMGDDYIGNEGIGKASHTRRKNFERLLTKHNKNLLRDLYKSLAKLSLGREIVMIAKKSNKFDGKE